MPAYPGLGEARLSQIVLMAIALFTAMDIYVVSLLIEPIKHDLGLTDVEVGFANTTTLYAAYGLLCIPMGVLVDRLRRVRMLAVALTLWCGGLAVTGLSSGLAMLVAGKIMLGAANAITVPAAMSLFSDYFAPERRSMAISSYGMGQVLGQAAAILIGGWGFGALTGLSASDPRALFGLAPWRCVSLLFALGGLAILPFLLRLREPARQEVRAVNGGSVRELWAYRGFLLPLFVGTACIAGAGTGVMAWIPPVLTRVYGQQPGDFAGWFGAVALISGLGGFFLAGRVATIIERRSGRGRLAWPAMVAALCCAPATLMAVMPSLPLFALWVTIFTIGYAVALAITIIALNFGVPNELRGAAIGINVVAISIAGALAGPLVAFVGEIAGGLGVAIALVGGPLSLIGAFCFHRVSGGEGPKIGPGQAAAIAP
ncbi:MAG: MFS transporter [Sphingomonas sp.]|uniref:MFS transporter n=1 Tax=Sphingomonas sp. TaxID=28214 RepID=UPI003F7F089D